MRTSSLELIPRMAPRSRKYSLLLFDRLYILTVRIYSTYTAFYNLHDATVQYAVRLCWLLHYGIDTCDNAGPISCPSQHAVSLCDTPSYCCCKARGVYAMVYIVTIGDATAMYCSLSFAHTRDCSVRSATYSVHQYIGVGPRVRLFACLFVFCPSASGHAPLGPHP